MGNVMTLGEIAILCGIYILVVPTTRAQAGFHEGEKLNCIGCHGFTAPDPSSRCLHCHAKEYRVLSEEGDAYTPGGDFFWLTKNFISRQYISPGESHGHNIISASHGLVADVTHESAPSDGTAEYRSAWLACTSCHDPHISRTNPGATYRLLGTKGYTGVGKVKSISFQYPAPIAKPSAAGDGDWIAESDTNHPDYISGMSEWCTNCHSGYVTKKGMSHPTGHMAALGEKAKVYNSYKTGRDASTGEAVTFDFLVPIESGKIDSADNDEATAFSNVMCLTCHRAHASAFPAIGRWDFKIDLLSNSPVLSTPEGINAYYGQSIVSRYGKQRKSLCFKCHA